MQGDPRRYQRNLNLTIRNKWYMHNPASVMKNDTHTFLWDFDIGLNHHISARKIRYYKNQQKKRTFVDFVVPSDHRIKLKKCEKKDKYLELARELKKTIEHKVDNYTNRDGCFWYSHQRIIKGTGGLEVWRRSRDYPNYNITENGQNPEKSLGDLRTLAVTQTSVKDYQLKLMWKTLKD